MLGAFGAAGGWRVVPYLRLCDERGGSMCVILAGNPWSGYVVHGPFADDNEAEQYQAKHLVSEDFWWIMPLKRKV